MGYQFDLVKLGVASRGADSNLVKVQAVNQLTTDPEDVEHFGEIDMIQSLGLTSMPAAPDDDGAATGFVVRDAANTDGIVIGGFDVRTAQTTFELGPGETCLHSTGKDYDSRVFCKDKSVSLVVTKKAVVMLTDEKFMIAVGGCTFEIGVDGVSIVANGGQTFLKLTQAEAHVSSPSVGLGATPTLPIATGTGPVNVPSNSVKVSP